MKTAKLCFVLCSCCILTVFFTLGALYAVAKAAMDAMKSNQNSIVQILKPIKNQMANVYDTENNREDSEVEQLKKKYEQYVQKAAADMQDTKKKLDMFIAGGDKKEKERVVEELLKRNYTKIRVTQNGIVGVG